MEPFWEKARRKDMQRWHTVFCFKLWDMVTAQDEIVQSEEDFSFCSC